MSDMMTFPDTWEDFEKSYGFTDNEEVYTNGARLIPSFRVKQWLEHMPSAEKPFKLPEIYVAEGYDTIEDEDGNIGFGVYAPAENQIYVVGDVEDEIRARALLHEVCHWVQAMCGRPFYEDEANEFSDIVYDVLTPVQPDVPDTNVGELISRQKAKDAIDMALDHIDHVPPWVYDKLLNALNEVPSAQPRKGKWIRTRTLMHDGELYCDQCGQEHPEQKKIWNFCPNCGCRMEEGEQE